MIKRTLNRDVTITAVENDIIYQNVLVERKLKLFGLTVWTNHVKEDIEKHKDLVEETKGIGFKK